MWSGGAGARRRCGPDLNFSRAPALATQEVVAVRDEDAVVFASVRFRHPAAYGKVSAALLMLAARCAVWAGVAQLVEHLICNQRVGGSNPFVSSILKSEPPSGLQLHAVCRRILVVLVPFVCSTAALQHTRRGLGVPHSPQRSRMFYGAGGGWYWCLGDGGVGQARCAQVAERLMAADCKSATLRVTEVRILPCARFLFQDVAKDVPGPGGGLLWT